MAIPTQWFDVPASASKSSPKGAIQSVKRSAGKPLHKGLSLRTLFTPIRTLCERHRGRIAKHLLQLSEHDRYLRFGYQATDEQVLRYVRQLDFSRDEVLGIFDSKLRLIAVAHVAFSDVAGTEGCAEFGVSVLTRVRGKGYGARMFERSALLARNRGVGALFVHALSENVAMLRIARNAGATVQRDGTESQAQLKLPAAGLNCRLCALLADWFAEINYGGKKQARKLWKTIVQMHEIRQGVAHARTLSGQ